MGGLIYVNIEFGILGMSEVYPVSDTKYNPFNSLVTILSMNFLLGLGLGIIEESGFKNRLRHLPFTLKLLLKTLLYIFIFVTTLLLFSLLLNTLNTGLYISHPDVYLSVFAFFTSYGLISIILFAGFTIALSLFFAEIVDYLGLDIVGNFFSGKYSKPVYENRIFMFLDMKDSTTIAEQIGHKRHYELINEYYGDMSSAIVRTQGTIYQYVGDEIVISWKLEDGLTQSNCLQCFFQIRSAIANKEKVYTEKYGLVPGFRAGIHCGEITRGQVGEIKRDLLYIGDVLNATARIQGLCKTLNADLLISDALRLMLPPNEYYFTAKGEFELKGRKKKEALFDVESD